MLNENEELISKDTGVYIRAGKFAGNYRNFCYLIKNNETSEEYYKIDDALKAGFGWELGPFESWDLFGYEQGLKFINDANKKMGASIEAMRSDGMTSFYKTENGKRMY